MCRLQVAVDKRDFDTIKELQEEARAILKEVGYKKC